MPSPSSWKWLFQGQKLLNGMQTYMYVQQTCSHTHFHDFACVLFLILTNSNLTDFWLNQPQPALRASLREMQSGCHWTLTIPTQWESVLSWVYTVNVCVHGWYIIGTCTCTLKSVTWHVCASTYNMYICSVHIIHVHSSEHWNSLHSAVCIGTWVKWCGTYMCAMA